MIPMASMILKWEKELEDPNRHLHQTQVYARLLKVENTDQPEPKSKKKAKINKESNYAQSSPCCELA